MECSVCFNKVNKKSKEFLNGCSHWVCIDCFKKLNEHKINTCPVCRANFRPPVPVKIIIRRRRRNLTWEEYRKHKEIVKTKNKCRREKRTISFYKKTSILY
jgi:hypothetical protein